MSNTTPPTGPEHNRGHDNHDVTPAPAPSSEQPATSRSRTGILVAAFVAAIVLAAGVGAAFALVASSDDDEVIGFENRSTDSTQPQPTDGGATVADDQTDVEAMLAAAARALTVADGDVVAIEERAPGTWKIEVQGNGREYEVLVEGDSARIIDEDDDDDGDDLPLTADVIESIVAAATSHTAGRVVQIEADDDDYDVDVRTSSGAIVELELNRSFTITDVDHDD